VALTGGGTPIEGDGEAKCTLRVRDAMPTRRGTDDQSRRLKQIANAHLRILQLKSNVTFEESFICLPVSRKQQQELLQL
jgi:hypothetical protein